MKAGLLFCYHLSSDDTVSFLRPRRRRAANTRRPLGVDMRSRKPCLLRRLRCDGWNVLFISRYFYIFPFTIWECKGSIFEIICKIFCKDFSTSLEMTVKYGYFSMKITCLVSKNGSFVQLLIGQMCTDPLRILNFAIAVEISSARSPPLR